MGQRAGTSLAPYGLLLAFMLAGCSTLVSVNGGYVMSPLAESERTAGALNFHAAVGSGHSFGGGVDMRTKFGDELVQFAWGVELYAIPLDLRVGPYLRAGVHALQFESFERSFEFGMFSPWIEGGLLFFFVSGGGPFISASTVLEYDIRFGSAPNEDYLSFLMGTGFGW